MEPIAHTRHAVVPDGTRFFLRDGCAALHGAVEARFGAAACETRDGYLDLLHAMWHLHGAVARAARPHLAPAELRGLEADRERLSRDLEDLEADPVPEGEPALTPVASHAGAFGALYVTEGSRLGGQFLARRAAKALGVTATHGARFLHGEGAATGARWRRFVFSLDEAVVTASERRSALAGARGTFAFVLSLESRERSKARDAG